MNLNQATTYTAKPKETQAYLRDPNGNRICLFNAGENRKNPPWRVK